MINYWDKRHVNQAIVHKFKSKTCLSGILHRLQEITDCTKREEVEAKVQQLKTLLTVEQKSGIKNEMYEPEAWNYLEKEILKDLNKLCRWTVQHLGNTFWEWTQAIESRNNKELNIWNGGATQLSVEECLLRYYEIDKTAL